MAEEVAVDRHFRFFDRQRLSPGPFRVGVLRCLAGHALAKEKNVADDGRSLAPECTRWESNRPQEIGLGSQVFPEGGVLFVEREAAGDEGQDAVGLEAVERFGDEEIMQRDLLSTVVNSDVGKWH